MGKSFGGNLAPTKRSKTRRVDASIFGEPTTPLKLKKRHTDKAKIDSKVQPFDG